MIICAEHGKPNCQDHVAELSTSAEPPPPPEEGADPFRVVAVYLTDEEFLASLDEPQNSKNP